MPSGVADVAQEHLVFVKRTLAYLALDVVQWGRERTRGRGGGNEGDKWVGKASVRLKGKNKL